MPVSDTFITNQSLLQEVITRMKQEGAKKLHILTDFDRTLTTATVDGKPVPSLISILRNGNYLTPDYAAKAHALYNHYAPIETDLTIPTAERKQAMEAWWRAHFKLLIESGLNKTEVNRAIDAGHIRFRDGVKQFLETLAKNDIPVIIMSSSALGGEAIEWSLKKAGYYFNNITVISNGFIWNEHEQAVGVQEPIIHGLSKDETAIQSFPIFEHIKDRPNVLLLGDNISDLGMVTGFNYQSIIKIGFLNENIDRYLPDFQQHYDLTITNDGTFAAVNNLLQQII